LLRCRLIHQCVLLKKYTPEQSCRIPLNARS
jgi:hypothetical protein